MRSPSLTHTILRFLPLFAAALAFSACGDGESPLAPSSEPTTPAAAEPAAVVANVVTSKTIAWISYRTGWTELYKMDPLGIQSSQLTALKTSLQGLSWSWDNKRLATVRYRGIDASHGHNDIWIVNADGSNGHWARTQTFPYDVYDPS